MRTTDHASDPSHDDAISASSAIGAITLPQPPTIGARTMALSGFDTTTPAAGWLSWPTSLTQ